MEDLQRIERIVRQHGGHLAEHPVFCGIDVFTSHKNGAVDLRLYISERTLQATETLPVSLENWLTMAEGIDWDAALARITTAAGLGLLTEVAAVNYGPFNSTKRYALRFTWDIPVAESGNLGQ